MAAQEGHVDVVKSLISSRANLEAAINDGFGLRNGSKETISRRRSFDSEGLAQDSVTLEQGKNQGHLIPEEILQEKRTINDKQ